MTEFNPIRELPDLAGYGSGDVLVVFGEVFGRGYVNGLIDAAEQVGMKVVYGTVGRRNPDGTLRGLTDEEIAEKGHGPIINVPLEAGFTNSEPGTSETLADVLGAVGKDWANAKLDFEHIEVLRSIGEQRFRKNVTLFMEELRNHVPEGANLLFAHTMAGGIPTSKQLLVVTNRIFKGTGARGQSSQEFWESDLGKVCEISFEEVSARTLGHLIDLSDGFRDGVTNAGGRVSYVAYGYHGTECLIGGKYRWQTYAPYLQGFAKIHLEQIAAEAHGRGINVGVFNAPEILTNSSGVFVGVELPLYRLFDALEQEPTSEALAPAVREVCAAKLKGGEEGLAEVKSILRDYHRAPEVEFIYEFDGWPPHNRPEQMDLMVGSAMALRKLHVNEKDLMTLDLSRLVFSACGHVMLHKSWDLDAPVYWVGHDIVAKALGRTGLPEE
ncbi:enoyl ACP reductase FabMG family protein [Amaricoccus tamworthensis]|uniref:enoyl ACP reductase FabMG family protein n=1 Tax=Amaricoccus tamworthensis TaxID=57002 RepID=UPI003C7D4E9C